MDGANNVEPAEILCPVRGDREALNRETIRLHLNQGGLKARMVHAYVELERVPICQVI